MNISFVIARNAISVLSVALLIFVLSDNLLSIMSSCASQSSQNELEKLFNTIEKAMSGAERIAELIEDPGMRKKLATALEKLVCAKF